MNSAIPLNVVAVMEPRMELNNERTWVVLKGGEQVTYYPFPSTSFSSSQFNFICNPPSANTVLDRNIFIEVPFTINFTANSANPSTDNLLQPGRDAFRAYPVSSITNTLTATINGFPTNIELSQVIHAMSRFHTPLDLKNGWMSKQPSMEDNYQNYADADGATNNPLGGYSDAAPMSELGRGAYPFTVVSNTPTAASISGVLREQVFLPPFLWNQHEQAGGLSNLTSLTFNWVMNNNLQRIWSHSDINDILVSGIPTSTIGSVSVNFTQPTMYLGFLTPKLSVPIPPKITYPYYQISRYTTQTQTTAAYGIQNIYKSNIIQLDSIPRKLYVFLKQSDQQIYGTTLRNLISTPDVFLQINNLNITWNNQQGVLSGASPVNLYDFSVQNGYNKSWTEFNGVTQRLSGVAGNNTNYVGLEGSIVCIEMGKDIGLNSVEAEGLIGNYNLQVQVTATNVNQNTNVVIKPDLYIIAVYDGTLVISNTSAMASIGVVSKEQVLNAPVSSISYNQLNKMYGGDFFGRFKDLVGNVHDFVKGNKLISSVSGLIPHPVAQVISQGSKALGYGMDRERHMDRHMDREMHMDDRGGISAGMLYGGKHMDKHSLRKRLNM